MKSARAIRKRQSKNREELLALPEKGVTARNRALTRFLQQLPARDSIAKLRTQLNAYIEEGKALDFICEMLGPNTLAMLPGDSTRFCNIQLQLKTANSCFKPLSDAIQPSE
jgi:hypothetical protein